MQFSHQSLRSYLRKLHLEPGDCLVVSHQEILKQLQRMPAMNFHVPVIFAPDGQGLTRATRAEVLEILERIDEAEAVAQGIT